MSYSSCLPFLNLLVVVVVWKGGGDAADKTPAE
jgi:hypothetical protein